MATGEIKTEIVVTINKFPQIISRFRPEVNRVLKKTTMDIYALSQTTVPVRKDQRKVKGGALKNSGVTEYSDSAMEGSVTYGIEYAVYVHEGTRYMPARPFLKNAYDDRIDAMITALSHLERRLI